MHEGTLTVASRTTRSRAVERVFIALTCLVFVLWAGLFIRESSFVSSDGVRRFCLADDAMISMRYAWNLAHGSGLVWNPGERVEGITNLLMTLLMATLLLVLSKGAAVLAVQLLGIVFVLLTAFFAWRVVLRVASESAVDSPWLSVVVFAATLAYYPLAYWSLLGMETGLLAALLSAALLVAVRRDDAPRPSLALAVLLGLAMLTRPDAAVFVAIVAAYRATGLWRSVSGGRRGEAVRCLITEWLAVGAFVFGVSVFRFVYYGHLTPNTYLLKLGGFALRDRLPNGLGFIGPFLDSSAVFIVLALVMAVLDLSRLKLSIAGLVVAATAYQVWVGGDIGRCWRIMTPAMPLFCGLLVVEIAALVTVRARGTKAEELLGTQAALTRGILAAIVTGLSVAALIQLNAGFGDDILLRKSGFLDQMTDANRGNVDVAVALRAVTLPGATVGVSWAGAIPYYTELNGVDFLGKSDPRIAALAPDISGKVAWAGMKSVPGHNKYDLAYSIQERRPTYIQEFRWGRQNLREWVAQHYVSVLYRGTFLCLLENSPHVEWRRVPADREHGCDESALRALRSDDGQSAPRVTGRPPRRPRR